MKAMICKKTKRNKIYQNETKSTERNLTYWNETKINKIKTKRNKIKKKWKEIKITNNKPIEILILIYLINMNIMYKLRVSGIRTMFYFVWNLVPALVDMIYKHQ